MSQHTPDAWIERQPPEDYEPQDEDRCPVCDRIDCVCPPDSEEQSIVLTVRLTKPKLDELLVATGRTVSGGLLDLPKEAV